MFYLHVSFLLLITIVHVSSEQYQAPIILRESSDNEVPIGSRKVFTCNAIGYPPPTYLWLREWKNLSSNYSSLSYFEIGAAKKQDQGSYRCLAKNAVGVVASKAARLTVWYFDGLLDDQGDQLVQVHQSDAVILRLPSIGSSPEPTVQWFMKSSVSSRDHHRIIHNEKYFITSSHHLVILNVDYDDEKIYFAVIENIFVGGTKQSSDYRLQVNRRVTTNVYSATPQLTVKPTDQLATIGDAIKSFECVANTDSRQLIEILWQKNSIFIDSNNARFHIGPYNRTLEVRGITADDQGNYSCHVRFRYSDSFVNASAQLIVRGVPMIATNFPLIQNVDLQEKVHFTCQGTSITTSFNVTWYKDAVLLSNQTDRIRLIAHDLIIEHVEWNDQGMYQCFMTNDVGEDTRSTWLKVKSESPTVSINKNVTVFNGTDVQLTCSSTGSPKPNISWYKVPSNDDHRIPLNDMNGKYAIDQRTGILSIFHSQRNDSAQYECEAQNILGAANGRTSLLVRRPTKILSLPAQMKIVKAQSFRLTCEVFTEDDVLKRIIWYFNQQPLYDEKLFNESTIAIDTPQNQDTGNYTCVVESNAGNDSRTTEVTIIELPWPPTFVRASFVNKSMGVNLTWISNFDGNIPLERYTIQMSIGSSSNVDEQAWQTKEDLVNPRKTWTLLRGLRPFTTYRFRLSAWNQLGEGQVSEPSNQVTLPEEIPSGTVQSLTAQARDSTSVIIDFVKPIESTINGELIGYSINYALNYPNPTWKSIRVNSTTQSFVLKDLMTWESYLITVSVINNVGTGPASEIVKVRTLEGIPSRSPTIVRAESVNATAINLTWTGPPAAFINGILRSFQIELYDSIRNRTITYEQQAKPIEIYQLTIGQLKKYTNYSIRINCATKIGHGPWSTPSIYVQTHEDVPDQVENLTFSNVYDTSLDILWQPPTESNGELIGYELEWYRLNSSSDRSTFEIPSNSTKFTIKNLSATTWYSISVRAKTRKGFGSMRSASIESGYPPEMPSPPTNLEMINVETRSASIQFSPGYTGKTNILRYVVEIQMRSNYSQWENHENFQIEQTNLIVRDLYPNQLYRVRMSAVNIKGASNVSLPSDFFRTKADIPSMSSPLILAQAINSTAIRVRWMPIPTFAWNSDAPGYILTINDSKSGEIKIKDPFANQLTIHDLYPPNAVFQIQLRTFNRMGPSNQSIETIERTFETVPRRPPSNLRVTTINGSSVRLSWNELEVEDRAGFITHYRILYSSQVTRTIDHADNRSSIDFVLNDLDGLTNYSFAVSACTASGCSDFSETIHFLTEENVPSKPTEVFFPDVDHWSAKMIWQKPRRLNGNLLGYRLIYWRSDDEQTRLVIDNLTATAQTYLVEDLEKTTPYTFILCAKTRYGCGEPSINRLLTIEKRDRPAAPYPPIIVESSINATSLILTWRKDSDFNYAPIRYTFVQYEEEETSTWKSFDPVEKPDGQTTSLLIENLKPNTKYRFRIAAQNDMGVSDYSRPTNFIRTKQTVPNNRPEIESLSTDVPCQLDLQLKDASLFDNTTRLKVFIRPMSNEENLEKTFYSLNGTRLVSLKNLCDNFQSSTAFVVFVCWSNTIGDGPLSFANYFHLKLPAPLYQTIDSVNLTVLSSREISVRWSSNNRSPSIAYRIQWRKENNSRQTSWRTLIADSNETQVILDDLIPFTEYKIVVESFNIHGNGAKLEAETVRTDEDAPSSVEDLTFSYVTFTSLKLDWKPPKDLNGILRSYELTYDNRLSMNTSSTRVKTIKQRLTPENTSLKIDELDPYQFYEFSLCACTIRCGLCVEKSIQTGPQRNSPLAPLNVRMNKQQELIWQSSIEAEFYLVEISIDNGRTWRIIDQLEKSPYSLSSGNLQTNKSFEYFFRLYAVNQIGISEASEILRYNISSSFTSSWISPWKIYSNLQTFLQNNEIFFYLLVALIGLLLLMFICILFTCCCCRMKLKKNKLLQSTHTLASNLNGAESKQSLYTASTLLTPSARQRNRDSLALSDLLYNNFASRSPPRPIPTPIVYDDLTSTKSLVTQNPTGSEENQSNPDYPWYHSLPQQLYTYMSNNHLSNRIHEEHEAEEETDETDLTVAFNGAILMNNVPRSRAAVNGCSSFAL